MQHYAANYTQTSFLLKNMTGVVLDAQLMHKQLTIADFLVFINVKNMKTKITRGCAKLWD